MLFAEHFAGGHTQPAWGLRFLDLDCFTSYMKCMKSRVSSKGQVTAPADVRKRLGLQPGTVVTFEIYENGVLLRKGSVGGHPVDRSFGILRLRKPTDALLDEMRGPRSRRA